MSRVVRLKLSHNSVSGIGGSDENRGIGSSAAPRSQTRRFRLGDPLPNPSFLRMLLGTRSRLNQLRSCYRILRFAAVQKLVSRTLNVDLLR